MESPSLERRPDSYAGYRGRKTLRRYIAWILQGFRVLRTRRALRNLTDDELRDIGLQPDVAAREARRPIWDRNSKFDWWG